MLIRVSISGELLNMGEVLLQCCPSGEMEVQTIARTGITVASQAGFSPIKFVSLVCSPQPLN